MDTTEINPAFLIADLAGYTSVTEIHGDYSATDLVTRYIDLVDKSLDENSFFIERVGDEVLVTSSCIESIIKTAVSIQNKIESEPNFPSVHIGLHTGTAIKRSGKYYGHTLNLTSRICSYSRAGQILCSKEIAKAVEGTGKYNFLKLGDIQFKNISKRMTIYEIITNSKIKKLSIDPVCKMQIDLENPPAKLPYNGKTYFFCSLLCSKEFINNPMNFI